MTTPDTLRAEMVSAAAESIGVMIDGYSDDRETVRVWMSIGHWRAVCAALASPSISAPDAQPVAHPTLEQCEAAGRGPENCPGAPYNSGGLPDTPEERSRFEAYLRGHCWEAGRYDPVARGYDTAHVRCLYGVWRDRGALAVPQQPIANPAAQQEQP